MPRPIRAQPYNPNKPHDRRASDLLRNAQVAAIEISCPVEKGDTLVVMRSIRNDPLAALHSRKTIDEAQYQAGRAFQGDFETIERGAKAIDPSAPYVDCSRGPERVSDAYSKAFSRLNNAVKELGADGSPLIHAVLIHSMSYKQIAESRQLTGRRWEEYFGMRVHECLHRLSYIYGFAIEPTGKQRIKVMPNFVG